MSIALKCLARQRYAVAAFGSGLSIWMQLEAQRPVSRVFLALHSPIGGGGARKFKRLGHKRLLQESGIPIGTLFENGTPRAVCVPGRTWKAVDGWGSRLAATFADCVSANFAFRVQPLHLGNVTASLVPRCLGGVRSGPIVC
jgi:hypothetical protein